MAEQDGQEKTEPASPRRREEARREGQVVLSREAAPATLLAFFSLALLIGGDWLTTILSNLWRQWIPVAITAPDMSIGQLSAGFNAGLTSLLPVFGLLLMLAALLASFVVVLQVGWHINPLKLKPERLNPLEGFKRIFSIDGLVELFKSIFKMGIIGVIVYGVLSNDAQKLLGLSQLPMVGLMRYTYHLVLKLLIYSALAMILLAVVDYLYQRFRHEQRLMMTKQETKEEHRQSEGDPQLRARVRQIQRDASRSRMMQEVPRSDLVVTNPTHFAVALRYDSEVMHAPELTAKGADWVALRIRKAAEENSIPIVENPTVARSLFNEVEIGDPIPERFFQAVAEILAYVYRLKQGNAGNPPANQPSVN